MTEQKWPNKRDRKLQNTNFKARGMGLAFGKFPAMKQRRAVQPTGAKSNGRNRWPVENVKLWPIAKLLPYARNPKTHPPEQVELIARSLDYFGQAQLVVVAG